MTASQFFAKRTRREFGFWLAGWISDTGEMSAQIKPLAATPNRDKGWGTTNPGGYSNAKVDALLDQALGTIDDAQARRPPGRGEPHRHGRLRRAAAALRDDHLGDAQGAQLYAAGRPDHPGDAGETVARGNDEAPIERTRPAAREGAMAVRRG